MSNDRNTTIISSEPLVRVDFSRISVGDYIRLMQNNQYIFAILLKCSLDDLDDISADYALQIVKKFGEELAIYFGDIVNTFNLLHAAQ